MASATTIGHNSARQNDFLIAGSSGRRARFWGPAFVAGPLFVVGGLRGRGGPGRV